MVMGIEDFDIHPKFTLNGRSYNKSGLKELAYDLVKEGTSFENAIGKFLADWLDDSLTLKVHTSGSTGAPKEIFLKKVHMVNSALATGEFFNLQEGNSALLCLPADYIAGKMMLVRAMVLGLELDYVEPSSNPLVELSKSYDFAAMVPLQFEESRDEIGKVKTLIVGGAPISRTLKEKVQQTKTAVFETYGMTETITHVAVRAVSSSASTASSTGYLESNFKALPNIFFSIDERECLVITAPKISADPVVTNDIIDLISETEFEWLGRHDNVINSGGIKISPERIEVKLTSEISNRFFLTGIPDERLGRKLVLIVEGEIDAEELLRKLKNKAGLERLEIPKQIFSIPKFIETDTGKIRRIETLTRLNL